MALYDYSGTYSGIIGTTWTPSTPLYPIISAEVSKHQYDVFPYVKNRDKSNEQTGVATFVDTTVSVTRQVINLTYHAAIAMLDYSKITKPEEAARMYRDNPYIENYTFEWTTTTKTTKMRSFKEGEPDPE
jgi:hypothetical protein